MAKDKSDKVELHRPFYPLSEAAEIAGLKVDDLIHLAMMSKLHISIYADGWTSINVFEIDNSDKLAINKLVRLANNPQSISPDEHLQILSEIQIQAAQPDGFGNFIVHDRDSPYGGLYGGPLQGFFHVSKLSFSDFTVHPTTSTVILDLSGFKNGDGLIDGVREIGIEVDQAILVQDALASGKFVVLRDDLKRLLGRRIDVSLLDLMDDPRWPPELGLAFAAWQYACKNVPEGDQPGGYLREWLKSKKQHDGKPLSSAAVERIATVANWHKASGAPKKKGED